MHRSLWIRVLAGATGTLAVLAAGCGFGLFPWDKPEDWDYHEHPLALHIRTVGHTGDSLGIESCRLKFEGYTYARPPGEGDMNYCFSRGFPKVLEVELAWPDTEWHSYRTTARHFTGYQLAKGGDTTTLCRLTGSNQWTMYIDVGLTDGRAVVMGRTMSTYCHDISEFPNRVKGKDTIEVELTVNLGTAFCIHENSAGTTLHVVQEAIARRQR